MTQDDDDFIYVLWRRILFFFIMKESRYTFAIRKTVLIAVIFGLLQLYIKTDTQIWDNLCHRLKLYPVQFTNYLLHDYIYEWYCQIQENFFFFPDNFSEFFKFAALCHLSKIITTATTGSTDASFPDSSMSAIFSDPHLEFCTQDQLVSVFPKLNNMSKRLGFGWTLHVEFRRKFSVDQTKSNSFPEPASCTIDSSRKIHLRNKERTVKVNIFSCFSLLSNEFQTYCIFLKKKNKWNRSKLEKISKYFIKKY